MIHAHDAGERRDVRQELQQETFIKMVKQKEEMVIIIEILIYNNSVNSENSRSPDNSMMDEEADWHQFRHQCTS